MDCTFDTGNAIVRETAEHLDGLMEKCVGDEPSFELGRLLGDEWAPNCRSRIKNTEEVDPFEQIDSNELPQLFRGIESQLKGLEREVFRQGFGWGVKDYQNAKEECVL
jgi:hypothetical protein